MIKVAFRVQAVILALGWVVVIASATIPGLDSDAPWIVAFFVALTISFVLIHRISAVPPAAEHPRLGSPSWVEKLVASIPGKIVIVLLSLVLMIGTGGVAGVLVCLPVKGISVTLAGLPEILGTAIVGAAVSIVGFGLFTLLLSLLGPVLSVAFETWIGYIAPVIGGVVGAAVGSGYVTGGLGIVGVSALTGGLVLVMFDASTSKKKVTGKAVGESLVAGMGLGFVQGVILALFFWLFKALSLV